MSKKNLFEESLAKMVEEALQEKHLGFAKLKRSLAHKKGVSNPGAVAAAIGRKKYGDKAMQHAAETGHELHEDPLMADMGKEMEGNYLVRDIMTTLGEDHKLHKEIQAAMEGTSDPAELDSYREVIRLLVQTIDEKTKMVQVLSKSKKGMPESLNILAQMVREAVEQVMTEKAPPGLEDMVLALKKQYGEDSPRPFQIAWAHYNKKHGK